VTIPNEEKRRAREHHGNEELILGAFHQHETPFPFDRRSRSQHTSEPRFIRLDEVLTMCRKSRSSVYELIKKGEFPAPVKLRGRSSAWISNEIVQWLKSCIDAREPK
jgi:predicted DNA-binding transcriptional regulator AlpA